MSDDFKLAKEGGAQPKIPPPPPKPATEMPAPPTILPESARRQTHARAERASKTTVCGLPTYDGTYALGVVIPSRLPDFNNACPDCLAGLTTPTRAGREGDSQPMPTASTHPIAHEEVAKDLNARLRIGIERYGQPLRPFNGRKPLRDAYEEALDLCVYLWCAMYEEEHGGKS
jgi:hypothetical protein